ncbi:MAG TPA: type IV pilus assembly protein PilM [Syntrophales bacterium]|mgnify:CR=1 FL=1|nr:type IV pilus assembly protein PilM [Syntrophales bacterium]HOM06323.1 type IV pilus assembly protein PilM [Syntrophales bacterium]HON99238.1 type IV pilus assembly protein PilM [Syntrophales bacterium]HPC00063.1 type IV pilus assembly protein PilM [Syntrophales bacterium]HPQ05696.1 type IV pilus assembly protein PilM [Syntrophales bacterium]
MAIKDLLTRRKAPSEKTPPGGGEKAPPPPKKKAFAALDLSFLSKFDLKNLISGRKEVVGLDIGSSSLKLAEILETKEGFVLNRFLHVPLKRGVIVEGVVTDIDGLAEAIKDLFKGSGCQKKGVVTSLSGHSVIVKKAQFPARQEEGELRELIRDEAGKYLPFDSMDEIYFDFQVLGRSGDNPNQNDVMIVAAKRDIVDAYVEAIAAAGLTVVVVDVDTFALETMYERNYEFSEEDVVAVVNIGASITNINVMKGGGSIFTRDFGMGGDVVTEQIQSSYGVSFEEAERMKIFGIEGDEMARQSFRYSLVGFADPVCSEIDRSIDYFRSTYGDMDIKEVLLAGGGALIPGLGDDLSARLRIPTTLVDPFKKIALKGKNIDPEAVMQQGPAAAVAVGLAMRRPGDK